MTEPRKRDAERTRQRLLDAALAEFTEKGFDAARVDEIAARADANKRLIYLYFGNKEQLYREVLTANLLRLLEASQRLIDQSDDPIEQTKGVVRHFFNFLAEHPDFVRLLAWDSLHFDRWDHGELVQMLGQGLREMFVAVNRGIAQGVFRADLDPRLLVISAVGLCLTFFQRRLLTAAVWQADAPPPDARDEALAHILQVLFDGILAPPARATA